MASVTKVISPKYGEFMRGEIRKERMMRWQGGKVRISWLVGDSVI
jgi:hypothetical protein